MYKLIGYMHEAHLIAVSTVYSQHEKDRMLAGLMTEMERVYSIPMLRDPEWEKKNPSVITAYKFISNLRKL